MSKKTIDSALDEAKEQQEQVKAEPTLNPHHAKLAYSIIENEGKYHVITVEFDPNTLVSGKVKKIESNTDKFLMQERLQVLLMSEDLL
jgi:hypothetical protein